MESMKTTEDLMYSTVQIINFETGGSVSAGTGFFIELQGRNSPFLALVTNKHVVKNAERLKLVISIEEGGLPSQKKFAIDTPKMNWIEHENPDVDLALLDISSIRATLETHGKWYIKPFKRNQIMMQSDCEKLAPADEVFMIGYPDAIRDEVNNQPIFRRGVFATHPKLDFDGKPYALVDMAVVNGSSGSPVVVFEDTFKFHDGTMEIVPRREAKASLYGVAFWTYFHQVSGVVREVPISHTQEAIMGVPNNLGKVIKADRIFDLEKMAQER